jgi:hypothetical protein
VKIDARLYWLTEHFSVKICQETAKSLLDLFSAGTLVTPPGGHGTEYGFPIPTITAADQADAFVAARVAEGSDYIKIVYDILSWSSARTADTSPS